MTDQNVRSLGQRFSTPKSAQTYQRVLDAAIDCFRDLGYHRTNMSNIAERAGVTRGRVQYYFDSTEHLLSDAVHALLGRVWGRYMEKLYAGAASAEAFDELMKLRHDPDQLAWLELVAASRNEPMLRRVVERAQTEFDEHALDAQRKLLNVSSPDDETKLRVASDLVLLLLNAMTLSVITVEREERFAALERALREMLAGYWTAAR
ncbi:MAG TPA: TetR/AcrR family transcriptional regulator [Pseudomonadales bacterium]|nr:TetR/AcrR family transcriptional regulator [Pseudomonadales bacterium]